MNFPVTQLTVQVNQKYGYIRVSSKSQESNSWLESQKQELLRHQILLDNIRIEIGSAADSRNSRPILKHLIDVELQTHDLLMVTKIDRCSRTTLEYLQLQEQLFQRSITFVVLDLPYSTNLATNKLIATYMSAIAVFEKDQRRERQAQGILAAKQAGKYKGRKTVIDKSLIKKVKYFKEESGLTVTQISKRTGKCRATIYRVLKDHLGYVPSHLVPNNSNPNESNQNENDTI
jgi:DNA invertase Pin-like site-specific DNA recombinase